MNTSVVSAGDLVFEYVKPSPDWLRGVSLFSELSDKDIACFQDASQIRTYKKGKILYIEEEPAEYFYVINTGWIKLFHTMPDGDEVILDMLTTGHMVGENAIFEQNLHTSSAQIVEDTQLLTIPSKILKEQICLHPALALGMLSSMFLHHRNHYHMLALNAMQSAPQRVASFLLRLCPPNIKKGTTFYLPYDKTLIADTLGMKGATFSRALNILRHEIDLNIHDTRVDVSSVEQLIKFVHGSVAAKYMPKKPGPRA